MSEWVKVGKAEDVLENGGSCVKVGDEHIAVFNFNNRTEWYAVQYTCPHKEQSVLSRGLIGEEQGEPKSAQAQSEHRAQHQGHRMPSFQRIA